MTELETLRKEINELRERVALLESRLNAPVRDGWPIWKPYPTVPGLPWNPDIVPYKVTCETVS